MVRSSARWDDGLILLRIVGAVVWAAGVLEGNVLLMAFCGYLAAVDLGGALTGYADEVNP